MPPVNCLVSPQICQGAAKQPLAVRYSKHNQTHLHKTAARFLEVERTKPPFASTLLLERL
ncbi:hypothetical protein Q31a_32410 [Aureliella helgolandensis]|uniref:Uncharacterized protein n=1 Tax=Aureliella helgolandensis TaxID=2527968 RepID=A0A518G8M6_9BACT|nr:hypothetical protein Q31a_32410 [Aureliella helgolandensis]